MDTMSSHTRQDVVRITMGVVTRYFINSIIPQGCRGGQGTEAAALDDLGAEAEGLPGV